MTAEAASGIEARWRALAEATLKGGDFDKRLVGRTEDGLRIEPIYTRTSAAAAIAAAGAVGVAPFVRGGLRDRAAPWVIAQRIDLADPAVANAQALEDLENGASGLVLVIRDRQGSARGLRLASRHDIDRLMAGIRPELIQITLEAGEATPRIAALFAAWVEARGHEATELRLHPGLDPLGLFARTGRIVPRKRLARSLVETIHSLDGRGFAAPLLFADGRPWSEAGASEAQELGFALASALDTLRLVEAGGGAPEDAAARLAFKLALDADQVLGIAKIRAARLLWARATEAMGHEPRRAEVRVESARRMLTARDPWVNLLRGTVACFAGAVGGADEIALHPHSAALGVPDGFARRLARNTQAILMEESGLGRVADPAGGSGAVESLTQALAERAWEVFRGVERQGGLFAALVAGGPQAAVRAVREKRAADVARRKRPITGVSEFPLLGEAAVPVLPDEEAPPPVPGSEGGWADGADLVETEPLPSLRLAEPFEALRAAAERAPEPPRVFLAAFGAPAETVARATFSKGFFEAGGVATVSPPLPAKAPTELAGAFAASGARAACLCSSDERYAAEGAEAARVLKEGGASFVAMAGNPGDARDVFTAAGVDLFVHAGLDLIETLREVHRRLGV
jgi:methylmalonyl-CoA mutase